MPKPGRAGGLDVTTDVTDGGSAGETAGSADPAARQRRRRERQARVGLLRNPNRAPLPPPRRPALIGRTLVLRSSRRPPAARAGPAPEAAEPMGASGIERAETDPSGATPSIIVADAGRISRIDIDRLDALAAQIGPARRTRRAFAAHVTDDGTDPAAPAPRSEGVRPDPRPAGSSVPDDPKADDPPPDHPPPSVWRSAWRGLLARIFGTG